MYRLINLVFVVLMNDVRTSNSFSTRTRLLPFQHIYTYKSDNLSKPIPAFKRQVNTQTHIRNASSNTEKQKERQRNHEEISIADVDVSLFAKMKLEHRGRKQLSSICVSYRNIEDGSKIIGILNELIDIIPSNKSRYEIVIYIDEKIANQEVNQRVEHFLLPAIHRLFLTYLVFEREHCRTNLIPSSWDNVILRLKWSGRFVTEEQVENILSILQCSGWNVYESECSSCTNSNLSQKSFLVNPSQLVRHLIFYALTNCSGKIRTDCSKIRNRSVDTLRIMSLLSSRRVAYGFINAKPTKTLGKYVNGNEGRTISRIPSILPSKTVNDLTKIISTIKHRGWLNNNPDSVDGMPSLHMNIISGGSLLLENIIDGEENNEENKEFQSLVRQMYSMLETHLNEEILPQVTKELGFESLKITNVFVRNYGKDVQSSVNIDGNQSNTRFGLSEHYDITATATCVIALDDTAAQGTSGLYVIDPFNSSEKSSNHISLKQFFPLSAGDGVLHTWDVLHGVDVDPSLKRNSLVIWFTEEEDVETSHLRCFYNPSFDKAIRSFVLALSKENFRQINNEPTLDDGEQLIVSQYDFKDTKYSILDLHLNSALLGNVFALARIGTILIDQVDGNKSLVLSDSQLETCCSLVARFEWIQNYDVSDKWLPLIDTQLIINALNGEDYSFDNNCKRNIAKALLGEAALLGSAVAQVTLADILVEDYFELDGHLKSLKDDLLNVSSVLLTLASQQAYKPVSGSLERLERILFLKHLEELNEINSSSDTERNFRDSPVMQIIQTSSPEHIY